MLFSLLPFLRQPRQDASIPTHCSSHCSISQLADVCKPQLLPLSTIRQLRRKKQRNDQKFASRQGSSIRSLHSKWVEGVIQVFLSLSYSRWNSRFGEYWFQYRELESYFPEISEEGNYFDGCKYSPSQPVNWYSFLNHSTTPLLILPNPTM